MEQKVFATQKQMEFYKKQIEQQPSPTPASPTVAATKTVPKTSTVHDASLAAMLKTLEKQQADIAKFMKNTQSDLKQMQSAILTPQAKEPRGDIQAMFK